MEPPHIRVFLPGAPDPSKKPGIGASRKVEIEAPQPAPAPPTPDVKKVAPPAPPPVEKAPEPPRPVVKMAEPKPAAPEKKIEPPKSEKKKTEAKEPKKDKVSAVSFDEILKRYSDRQEPKEEESAVSAAEIPPVAAQPSGAPKKTSAGKKKEGESPLIGDGSGDGVALEAQGSLDLYYEIIRRNVRTIWRLPPELAEDHSLKSEVRIWIDREGKIIKKEFHKNSNNSFFDNTVVMAVNRLELPPIWFELQGRQTLEVNLVFSPELLE